MPVEVEARFRAVELGVLERLATITRLGGASLGPPRTVAELDRYLDTDDGRFAAARLAFRLRTRDGRTLISLKGPRTRASGAIHRRTEVEGPATARLEPSDWPPSQARELVDATAGGRPLMERFRLHQARTERAVTIDGRSLATLTLDRVRIEAAGRDHGELLIVELELGDDAGAAGESLLATLSDRLGGHAGLAPEPRTKLELSLERIGAT
jgi:inorganic triphosphatase YgiF